MLCSYKCSANALQMLQMLCKCSALTHPPQYPCGLIVKLAKQNNLTDSLSCISFTDWNDPFEVRPQFHQHPPGGSFLQNLGVYLSRLTFASELKSLNDVAWNVSIHLFPLLFEANHQHKWQKYKGATITSKCWNWGGEIFLGLLNFLRNTLSTGKCLGNIPSGSFRFAKVFKKYTSSPSEPKCLQETFTMEILPRKHCLQEESFLWGKNSLSKMEY